MPRTRISHNAALWEHDVYEDIHATFLVDTSFRTAEDPAGVLYGMANEQLWDDSGADIITLSATAGNQLAARHHDCLSARPDGMRGQRDSLSAMVDGAHVGP
jgi:hypothetical protein